MKLISSWRSLVGAAAAVCTLCGGTAAALAATTPTLGSHLGGGAKGFGLVKPKTVYLGGDPTGDVTKLTWKSWGSAVALGTGRGFYPPPGKPVADAVKVPVTLKASSLGTYKRHKAYRRLSFTFHYKGKAIKGSAWGICGQLKAIS